MTDRKSRITNSKKGKKRERRGGKDGEGRRQREKYDYFFRM